jgi:hypothetical protein
VNDVSRMTMHASGHVMVELASLSDRALHSLGTIRMHGSVPIFAATANHRFSAEEYVRFVEGWTVLV